MKILLLEDDVILNEIIEEHLLLLNHEVTSVMNGEEAEDLIYEELFDLLLFDVNVPYLSGFELLSKLRKHNINTPVIFITSRNTIEDIKKGFTLGADDYLKKPFELIELELRINNIKKLKEINRKEGIIKIEENIFYDYKSKEIKNNNETYKLSKMESKIFEYFIKNKNKIISIEEIGINNWSYDNIPEESTIRTYIKNIRKKINKDMISTLSKIGYKFNYSTV